MMPVKDVPFYQLPQYSLVTSSSSFGEILVIIMITPAQQLVGYANDDDASGKSVSNGLGRWL